MQTKDSQTAISPEEALEILKEGNSRFIQNLMLNRVIQHQVKGTSNGQYPFAVILSCIDFRLPVEIVFDQGIGDIFSARIAGNFINEDILGSVVFTCKVAGSKLIVVLGHNNCGAIKGAYDNVEIDNLTGLLKKIQLAVNVVSEDRNEVPGSSNPEFLQQVANRNVLMAIEQVKSGSPILEKMIEKSV